MAVVDERSRTGARTAAQASFFYRPEVRQAIYQIVLVVALVVLFYILITNTAANLKRQNIASGFGFIDRTAGFDVSQHLIDFDTSMTYGRAFLVGLLNTLLVAGLGIVLATVLGFIIGIARLSTNWLVARLATVYVEIDPQRAAAAAAVLLVFRGAEEPAGAAPEPRLPGGGFLNVRGLYLPAPCPRPASTRWLLALLIGVVASIAVVSLGAPAPDADRPAPARAVDRRWPSSCCCRSACSSSPGQPLELRLSRAQGLQFPGRHGDAARVRRPAARPVDLHRRASSPRSCAPASRACPRARRRRRWRSACRKGQIAAPRRHPAGHAHHHPAADQPVPEPDQELLAGAWPSAIPTSSSVWSGTVLNQTGQAVEVILITMGVYLTHQPDHVGLHELVQRAHGAGGAVERAMVAEHRHRRPCRAPAELRRRAPRLAARQPVLLAGATRC